MRHTIELTFAAALVGLTALACSNEGTAPATDQAQVLAAESDQLGAMVDTDFGAAGAAATSASTEPAGSGLSAALTTSGADTAPTFWGRLRVVPGGPRPIYHRDVTIQGDTARVEHDITFNGIFLVDTSADDPARGAGARRVAAARVAGGRAVPARLDGGGSEPADRHGHGRKGLPE